MTHMTKRRSGRGLILMAIVALSVLLASCGSANTGTPTTGTTPAAATAPGKGCTKIGVLLPETDTSPRWESKDRPALTDGLKAAIPGVTVDYNNANNDAAQQQTQADEDIAKGDCILVVAPVVGDQAVAIVSKAKAKGIPVIAYDRLIPSDDLSYYVSFDNIGVGKLQGQYIVDHYKDYVQSGKNNIVMINGGQTDNNALLFEKGAHDTLQPLFDSKALNLVYHTFTDKWSAALAQTEMDGALTANSSNISIAYVANDTMAGTVIASLKAHNLNKKVLVTGQDAGVAGIQNIMTGDQAMTVYKDISKEAQNTISLVSALNKGTDTASLTAGNVTKNPSGAANIPSMLSTATVVTKDNIADTVLKDGYVTKADICKGLPAGTDNIC